MTNKPRVFLMVVAFLVSMLTMSMTVFKEDGDYKIAVSIAEKEFPNFGIKRNDFKLIKIENDITKSSEKWKLTYLVKVVYRKKV